MKSKIAMKEKIKSTVNDLDKHVARKITTVEVRLVK